MLQFIFIVPLFLFQIGWFYFVDGCQYFSLFILFLRLFSSFSVPPYPSWLCWNLIDLPEPIFIHKFFLLRSLLFDLNIISFWVFQWSVFDSVQLLLRTDCLISIITSLEGWDHKSFHQILFDLMLNQ